ncbi:MAG: PDZ domain-containing protein [bacterium]|nr:PDZ domain-containing protein [bacterium]
MSSMMKRLILFMAVIGAASLSARADNKQDYDLGFHNFYRVSEYIVNKYEDNVDLAYLFEQAWKGVDTILPATAESRGGSSVEASAPILSSSREIQGYYADKIQETLKTASRETPEGVTPTVRDLWNRAINGLVFALHDPYSQYLPPKEHEELQRVLSGAQDEAAQFYGVGINVDWDTQGDRGVLVITPLPGSPADVNGVHPRDVIVAVNGDPLSKLEGTYADKLQTAIDMIKGEKDTQVTLTLMRPGAPEPIDVTLTRAPINSDLHIMREIIDSEKKVGYVRLSSFYADANKDVRDALRYLNTEGMQYLIFDLRYNPGGYLDQAVKIADLFLEKGDLITYTYGRESPYREFRDQVTSKEGFADLPMVILVNEASASASEVVTGALRDNHRAVVVGKTSFGKGSVQEVFPLEGDAGLRLTVAKYYTPSGKCIHELGINPDIEVDRITLEQAEEIAKKDYHHVSRLQRMFERDPQLQAAYEYLIGERKLADGRQAASDQ